MKYKERDIAYLAGLIDGEGHIRIAYTVANQFSKKHQWSMAIVISNTNTEVLNWVKKKFGGYVYRSQKATKFHKAAFKWVLNTKEANRLSKIVLPFSIIKRRQLQLLSTIKVNGLGVNISRNERQKSLKAIQEINILNRRGPA